MKKNIVIAIAMFLMFVFAIHQAFAQESSGNEFKVKLLDGLYLYQPKVNDGVFSPLFIVEKGALVDPYALAAKIGKEGFIKNYVEGKRFKVYLEEKFVGELTDVRLEFVDVCDSDVFLHDIRGKGKYGGTPLREAYSNKSLYVYDEDVRVYGSLTAIAAPSELVYGKVFKDFEVTEEDKVIAIEVIRKDFVPEVFERIKSRLEKLYDEKKVITGQWDKIKFLNPINAEDEKKGLIGLYSFHVSFRNLVKPREFDARYSSELLFSIFDGKIALIAIADGYAPAFSLGGIIDIDGAGTPELVLQEHATGGEDEEGDTETGRQVTVLLRTSVGWKEIYRTVKICDPRF
ncbi:hypothetical protein EPN18_09975 [bacterium]|nr:MAG: hypothetical protein EPN18_09975 [bacterium]